jgi:TetR/AcrR family transcriptional regulator, repressor for uid operon
MRKVDQAKYDEKRRRILQAAHGCFRRDGFRGASISDICTAAKMSPGHLYHYFESKEAIIKALIELRLEQESAFVAELTENADLVTALSMLIDRRLKRLRAHRFSLFLEMIAESARDPSIAAIVRRAERGTRELVSRLIREGQERGRVDHELDPDVAAMVIANIVFGLSHLAVVRDPTFDLNAVADMLKSLMERFLVLRR